MNPGRRAPGSKVAGLLLIGALLGAASGSALARSNIELPMAYGRVPADLYAVREPNIFTHNVGLLTLQITNVALIGNPYINDFSAGWRGGEYLYYSGLWIGAIGSDSEAHVSTAAPTELRPELSPIWTVYESYEGVKGGNRLGEGGSCLADDDGDAGCANNKAVNPDKVNEDFQNGLDDDGDGKIDEDYAAVGQQMFSCQYKDDTPEAVAQNPDHVPLNVLVHQRSFEWSTTGINEFVGFEFQIINTGDQRLKQLFLGFFSDSDIGPKTHEQFWTDDRVGWAHVDTTIVDQSLGGACAKFDLSMDSAFMWDAPDNGTTVSGGDVPGVFGTLFLGHTTDDTGVRAPQNVGLSTVVWFSSSGQNSDPQNDDERYQLLNSHQKPQKWGVKPDDYRYVVGAGPFAQLNPGESLVFQTAYVIATKCPGEDTYLNTQQDNLLKCGYWANAVNAQRVFNGTYVNADQDLSTGVDGKERCLMVLQQGDLIRWDDPCDTLHTTIDVRTPNQCTWVDADCNPCTGVDGKETQIHWVGTTAPPPPDSNTDPTLDPIQDPHLAPLYVPPAGDHRVVIQWDNSSELRKDPITQKELFEGYRVWRVDNWQRPEGSIGPSPEEWMKIAEFRQSPDEPPLTEDARSLREVRQTGVQPIGKTDDGKHDIYPIGYYQYEDTRGLINGKLYFYSVTAFGLTTVKNPSTGKDEIQVLGGLPSAVEAESVIPRWDASGGCNDVTVVPNPYRGRADWDLVPSDRDPTGTKIAFRNLPAEKATIRIYTLAGDLVKEETHDGSNGDGTYFWNLITRNGQNITSGIYLYSVEYSGGICRGRFVIIR